MPKTAKQFDLQEQIELLVQRIVRRFHPKRIILFGSQARGETGPDSDVDLLVVMDFEGSKLEKMVELQGIAHGIDMPVDLLITTPEEFAWRQEVVGTIEWPAAHEGKVLYEARGPANGRRQAKDGWVMPYPQQVITAIQEWLEKADNDLKTAVHTLKLGRDCPTDTVCFHAQQCIEKHLKAILVFQTIPFGKTHDLDSLMTLLPAKRRPRLARSDRTRITKYAAIIRYPLGGKDVRLAQARKEVAIARRVRREVRRLLPVAALRRRKK